LTPGESLGWYERADSLLGQADRVEVLTRLRLAARVVLGAFRRAEREEGAARGDSPALEAPREIPEGFSLKEEVRRLEALYIGLALKEAGGRVSRAARLLGFDDHGSLNALLKNKHPELLNSRLPKVPRRRSILKDRR
jgi:hypothetical protein